MSLVLQHNVVGREAAAPIPLDRRRRSLATIAKRHADRARPHMVSVHRRAAGYAANAECVRLRAEWRKTLVGANDVVLITYLPMGGGGGASGKAIGSALAMVALAAFAPWAVGSLGVSALGSVGALTTAGKAVAAGLVVGGGMLLSMASRPKADGRDRPVYGVSGGGNLPRRGDRIPAKYGRSWTVPDLAQPDYSVYEGEGQRLFKRLVQGLGRYQVHAIRVGDLTLWTEAGGVTPAFPGARVEIIEPGQPSTLVPFDVISSQSVAGQELPRPNAQTPWTPWFPVTDAGVTCNRVQIDFSLPDGAYKTTSEVKSIPVDLEWQIVEIDNAGNEVGQPTTLFRFNRDIKSTRPLRYTQIFDRPDARYAVRGRNRQGSNEHWNDRANWDGLRGHRPDVRTRDFVTEIGVQIPAGKNLGVTAFQDVQVEATRVLPVWDGFQWVEMPTRKAVWAYADIIRNEDYGGALPDARFDAEMCRFYANGLSEFDTFDGEIRGPDSVYNAAATVLGTLRAEPNYTGRIWSMARDEPKGLPRDVFTARNILRGSTEVSFDVQADDGAAHVIVEFDRDGDPKQPDEVEFYLGAPSLTPQRRRLHGVSRYEHATHLARWIAAVGFFRRRGIAFDAEHEGRLVTRGDRVLVDVHFMADARPYGVDSRSGLTLVLDQDVDVADGDHLVIRRRDGKEWGPVAIAQGSAPDRVVLNQADAGAVEAASGQSLASCFANDREDPTTVVIGPLAVLTRSCLLKSVQPSAANRNRIEVVNDHPGVWATVGEAIPVRPPLPSSPEIPARPVVGSLSATIVQDQTTLVLRYQVGAAVGAVHYHVEISQDQGQSWTEVHDQTARLDGQVPVLHDPDNPVVQVRAWAVGQSGLDGPAFHGQAVTFQPIVVADEVGEGAVDWPALSGAVGKSFARFGEGLRATIDEVRLISGSAAEAELAGYSERQRLRRELVATIAENRAYFLEQIDIAVGPDSALAQLVQQLGAEVFDPLTGLPSKASADSVTIVSAGLDDLGVTVSAQATSIHQLVVSVGENTASLTQIAEVTDGLGLRYGIIGNLNGQTGGLILAGVQRLDGSVSFAIEISGDLVVDGSMSALKLSVQTLSSISADVGVLTAGLIRDANSKMQIQLNSGRIVIFD